MKGLILLLWLCMTPCIAISYKYEERVVVYDSILGTDTKYSDFTWETPKSTYTPAVQNKDESNPWISLTSILVFSSVIVLVLIKI